MAKRTVWRPRAAELELKKQCKTLVLAGGKTNEAIAAEVGITPKTLRKWIKDGGWLEEAEAGVTASNMVLFVSWMGKKHPALHKRLTKLYDEYLNETQATPKP